MGFDFGEQWAFLHLPGELEVWFPAIRRRPDFTFHETELSGLAPRSNRYQLNHGLAGLRDNNVRSGDRFFNQARQVGFGGLNIQCLHTKISLVWYNHGVKLEFDSAEKAPSLFLEQS